MAGEVFGNENPIDRRLAQIGSESSQSGEIEGVVADVKSVQPTANPVTFQIYQPMPQEPQPGQPACEVMTQLDPDLPVRQLQTADAAIERANYETAVLRDMLSGFAVLGLALTSLGIYGVIARTMAQRTTEFAIRFALGARVRDAIDIVLTSGVKLVGYGEAGIFLQPYIEQANNRAVRDGL